jgi:hypothetical protein
MVDRNGWNASSRANTSASRGSMATADSCERYMYIMIFKNSVQLFITYRLCAICELSELSVDFFEVRLQGTDFLLISLALFAQVVHLALGLDELLLHSSHIFLGIRHVFTALQILLQDF